MGNSKFTPRLMRQEANDELEWTRESLRDRFEEEQKEEVKVERRPVKIVITGLLYLKNTVWLLLILLGLITLLHPELRHAFIILIRTFLMEAGLEL